MNMLKIDQTQTPTKTPTQTQTQIQTVDDEQFYKKFYLDDGRRNTEQIFKYLEAEIEGHEEKINKVDFQTQIKGDES